MSNLFKVNNRFASLNDEGTDKVINIKNRKENNYYKNDLSLKFKEVNNKIKKDKEQKNLSIENFPSLVTLEHNLESKKIKNSMNFLEKMKVSVDSEKEDFEYDIEYENLNPGWVLIKKDTLSNKIIHKYKSKKGNNSNVNYLENKISNDLLDNNQIINKLVNLYNKRKEDYIQLWGYDQWEQTFQFPNYDYLYFDKLDEIYQDEMLEEQEDDEDGETLI